MGFSEAFAYYYWLEISIRKCLQHVLSQSRVKYPNIRSFHHFLVYFPDIIHIQIMKKKSVIICFGEFFCWLLPYLFKTVEVCTSVAVKRNNWVSDANRRAIQWMRILFCNRNWSTLSNLSALVFQKKAWSRSKYTYIVVSSLKPHNFITKFDSALFWLWARLSFVSILFSYFAILPCRELKMCYSSLIWLISKDL